MTSSIFWGLLKKELIHHYRYKTREQAVREIKEYIEGFYNGKKTASTVEVPISGCR